MSRSCTRLCVCLGAGASAELLEALEQMAPPRTAALHREHVELHPFLLLLEPLLH